MMEFLVTAAQMKQCEEYTIHTIGLPSMVLMERAALAVTEEMKNAGLKMERVLVVCGGGNNGGDGFAVARLLDEQGVNVTLAFEGREGSVTEETFRQKNICARCGIVPNQEYQKQNYDVIVDALFGIGLSREIEGRYAEIVRWINRQDSTVIAVDIPSGIAADTGKVLGAAVTADLTVTFAYQKPGHVLYPGTEYCGKTIRRDIGITADGIRHSMKAFTYGEEDLTRVAQRKAYSNKGTYGKVLLAAGSRCMAGAAVLAARAACRSGCGLVKVFTQECNRQILQTAVPEALLVTWEKKEEIREILEREIRWADVIGAGPGLGCGEETRMILEVLRENAGKLVLDADALNQMAKEPGLLITDRPDCIVTPHIGEMVRLSGKTKDEILWELCTTAQEYARKNHVICVLKDARTVVSDGKQVYVNQSGNNGMAAGGSGDVLTGVICGFLAQGMNAMEAAAMGVFIHGRAGDLVCREKGAYAMMAGELADGVGEVLKGAQER